MKKLLLAVLIAGLLSITCAATAGAGTPTLKSLAKTVAALQKKVKTQATTVAALKSDLAVAEQTIAKLNTSVAPLLAIAPYVSLNTATMNNVKGPNIVFSGANLHVVSGSGATGDNGTLTGLGNLIVGYDEWPQGSSTAIRSGSNNLVVGAGHSFRGWGGFVCGYGNTIIGSHASVSGGALNTANDLACSVGGGYKNLAQGIYASVSGGGGNTATSLCTSISGGANLTQNNVNGWSAGTLHSP
jgi:hypothetical protein